VVGLRSERLANVVGKYGDRPAGAAVDRRGVERRPHGGWVRRIGDGVVDQHGIEVALEAQRTHVPDQVLTLRVELPADGQHRGSLVGQSESEVTLEVRGETPPAGAELEEGCRP
jgi:hypothetical protein